MGIQYLLRKKWIIVACILLCMPCIFCLPVKAYSNHSGVDDGVPQHVTDRFFDAINCLGENWVDEFIDSLNVEGKKSGGEQYRCYADVLDVYKACIEDDSLKFFALCDVALNETKELKNNNLYYNLLLNQVGFYTSHNNSFKAQKVAERLVDETRESADLYGIINANTSLATIHYDRGNYLQAIELYNKCLKYIGLKTDRKKSVEAQLLFLIADCYLHLGKSKTALNYSQQAYQIAKDNESLVIVALCHFKLGNFDEFKKSYQILKNNKNSLSVELKTRFQYLTALHYAVEGNYNKALSACDSIGKIPELYNAKCDVCKMMNNWKDAYKYRALSNEYADSMQQLMFEDLVVSASSEVDALYNLSEKEAEIRKNRITLACVSFGIFVLAVVLVFIVWNNRLHSRWQKNRIAIIKRYNKELAEAKEKAENANRLKTLFLQNLSHDVRTPLNAIVGFSQLLGLPDGFNSEQEKDQYNSYITNNSEMLLMLFEDILNMNELEKGNFNVVCHDTNCNELCRKILKCVEYRLPNDVVLNFSTNVADEFTINTDGRRVQQVLVNFLTNACKHTQEGEIRLECNVDNQNKNITFSVIDTGEGVPEDIRNSLFDRFVKSGSAEDSHGIGLNICTTIADKLGGTVRLDQSYNDGAKFDFILNI